MEFFDISSWQVFLILGCILCALEILLPGVILLPIGIGGIITAFFAPFVPIWSSILLWAFFSLLAWKGLRKFFQCNKKKAFSSAVDGLEGQKARVIAAVDPEQDTGKVKLYGDEWGVISEEYIALGEEVEIIKAEGNKVLVKKLSSVHDRSE